MKKKCLHPNYQMTNKDFYCPDCKLKLKKYSKGKLWK